MTDDLIRNLTYLEKEDNPFHVRCLDCRDFSASMISMTGDRKVAARFNELRSSKGDHLIDRSPDNAIITPCHLTYPCTTSVVDGPLFLARVMEEKWDIFLMNGNLYFSRSWTGQLVFKTSIEFTPSEAIITSIEANSRVASLEPKFITAQVDFLIKSHILDQIVPHPLPPDLQDDLNSIAMYSFSQYGRRAYFATYDNTLTST